MKKQINNIGSPATDATILKHMKHPKFIQIISGAWRTSNNTALTHAVYALSEDGEVYKFTNKDGWKIMSKYSNDKKNTVEEPEF